jgi:hypothetical protein
LLGIVALLLEFIELGALGSFLFLIELAGLLLSITAIVLLTSEILLLFSLLGDDL